MIDILNELDMDLWWESWHWGWRFYCWPHTNVSPETTT